MLEVSAGGATENSWLSRGREMRQKRRSRNGEVVVRSILRSLVGWRDMVARRERSCWVDALCGGVIAVQSWS